ncbi:EI24 domain-containing protein [bacterium]|nr:MAG: EI24 domain-containing protein [bacterium]
MSWYREALALLRRDAELRKLALRPMWASLLVFLVVFGLTIWLLAGLVTGLMTSLGVGALAGPLGVLAAIVAVVALSGMLFLTISSLVGSVFWDRLSRETEARVTGQFLPDPPLAAQVGDTFKRVLFSLGMALLSLCSGFLIPIAGPIAIAGFTATVDATGGSFFRRGIGLGGQLRRVLRLPGAIGFLIVAGVLSLVPFLNVAALPLTMTAGALMAARGLISQALDKPSGFVDTI